eukprot:467542-Rhodomonas_salina.1
MHTRTHAQGGREGSADESTLAAGGSAGRRTRGEEEVTGVWAQQAGRTALMIAAANGNEALAHWLLRHADA